MQQHFVTKFGARTKRKSKYLFYVYTFYEIGQNVKWNVDFAVDINFTCTNAPRIFYSRS